MLTYSNTLVFHNTIPATSHLNNFDFCLVIGSKAKAEICMNLAERLSEHQLNIQKLRDEISMIPAQAVEHVVKGEQHF